MSQLQIQEQIDILRHAIAELYYNVENQKFKIEAIEYREKRSKLW